MVLVSDDVVIRVQVVPVDRATREKKRFRVLVSRQRPHRRLLAELRLDAWLKDLAPSPGLMEWFRQASEQGERFRDRYFRELESKPEEVRKFLKLIGLEPVALLCGTEPHEMHAGRALRDFLQEKLARTALTGAA